MKVKVNSKGASSSSWALLVVCLSSLFLLAKPSVAHPVQDVFAKDGDKAKHAGKPHPKGFITRQGNRLKDAKGEDHFLSGINYWACMNLAADKEAGGDPERLQAELDQLQAAGVNHIRIMAASEGSPTPQPFRMLPALQPSPGEWDERIFVGLDRCVAEAGKRGISITATLGNTWQWSGGFGQLVSWAHGDEAIPYPRSWNISAPPQRTDGFAGYGNYTTDSAPYDVFTDFVARFFTDQKARDVYDKHTLKVLNRRNTVTGLRYKDDPTIMAWQPCNEPQAKSLPDKSDPYSLASLPNATDSMLLWHDDAAAFLKRHAPHQLVSTGFEGKQGQWYFKRISSSPNVDLACVHMWVENWNVYQQLNSSAENLEAAKAFAREYIANATLWASELPGGESKPLLLEEFGMARNNWENLAAGRYQYHELASSSNRDDYFSQVFADVGKRFGEGQNVIGLAPWAYGGIYRPSTQKFNSAGVVFAGDPPHESPGWYDVYSTDSKMLDLYKTLPQQQQCAQ